MIKVLLVKNKWLNIHNNNHILCPTEMILTDTINTLDKVETTVWYYDEIDYAKSVELFIQGFNFDVVIFRLHPYPTPQWVTADIIRQMKKAVMPNTPFVVWWGDSGIGCDHAYMRQIDSLMQLSIYYDGPFYMHDEANCKYITGLYDTNKFKDISLHRDIDVSIAGENNRPCRKNVIDSLRLNSVDVVSVGGWIDGWISDEEYVNALQRSKMSMCITGEDIKIRAHIFEIGLCGAMILADNNKINKMLFEPNKECVIFDDEFEALEACEYYLEHEDERLTIAEAGHKRALEICDIESYYKRIFEEVEVEY